MRGDDAKAQCPDIELVKVPNVREKADTSKYRDAGKDVANVLQKFTTILERASVDEAYLDITQMVNDRLEKMNDGQFVLKPEELLNTYAVGYETIGHYVSEITARLGDRDRDLDCSNKLFQENYSAEDLTAIKQLDIRLLIGASISNEIRAAVKAQTEYDCSAGIAHNKIIAKLACGINKPNKQTILPFSQIPMLFDTLPVAKIKGLGGKFGEEVCQRGNVTYIGQLRQYTEEQMQRKFDEKNGTWLYYICRGIDFEAVTSRYYSKSIGCCKRFPGRNCITGLDTLKHWLHELAGEIHNRLEEDMQENNRRAKQMVVSFTQELNANEDVPLSRSININNYDQDYLERNSLELIKANTKQFLATNNDKKLNNAIKFLGISVGKFESISRAQCSLQELFAQQAANKRPKSNEIEIETVNNCNDKVKLNEEENNLVISDKIAKTTAKSAKAEQSFFKNYLQSKNTPVIEEMENNKRKLSDVATFEECEASKENKSKHTKLDMTAASDESAAPPDYRANYAEFSIPEANVSLLELTTCNECHKQIPANEVAQQLHRDHHYALKLSQQLREESRRAVTSDSTTVKPSNANKSMSKGKSAKKPPLKVTTSKSHIDITKFFKASSETSTQGELRDSNKYEKCSTCQKWIEKSNLIEHLDFHLAKNMQQQLNKTEVDTIVIDDKDSPPKRKDLRPTKSLNESRIIVKPITKFFTKPNC